MPPTLNTDPLNKLPCYHTEIKAEWIDSNQHLSVPYYHVIMNEASWQASERWDFGIDYRTRTQQSSFILEMHLCYLRELKMGDPVAITVRIVGLDDKRMLLYYEISNTRDNFVAATAEGLSISMDMKTRRVIPFAPALHQRLTTAFETHSRIEPVPQSRMLRIGPAGLEKAILP